MSSYTFPIIPTFPVNFQAIIDAAEASLSLSINAILAVFMDTLENNITTVVTNALSTATTALNASIAVATTAVNTAVATLTTLIDDLETQIGNLLNAAINSVTVILNNILQFLNDVVNRVQEELQNFRYAAYAIGGGLFIIGLGLLYYKSQENGYRTREAMRWQRAQIEKGNISTMNPEML